MNINDFAEYIVSIIISRWNEGDKFVMVESKYSPKEFVGKRFRLINKDNDHVVFVIDEEKNGDTIPVLNRIAAQIFKKVEEKEHNSEYFTDNTCFNTALSKADVVVQTIFHKTTVVAVRFANGFVIVESSSCVHEDDYDKSLGVKLCMQKIEQKYMEYRAFEVCDNVYDWDSKYI